MCATCYHIAEDHDRLGCMWQFCPCLHFKFSEDERDR